ncbi:hypothetical protein GE09DRAFT_1166719 [Coniochaeta sp. 2T2.1]|nr:hypothetical protein GE09DRAFT_1166719 [Coniochaeta sp. 2T2.1]
MLCLTVGLNITRLFHEVIATNRQIGDDASQAWPARHWEAEYDRFELWAVNIGLFVPGHGALDYRVREAASLRDTLLRFMSDLKDSLDQALAYCNGFIDIASPSRDPLDIVEDDAPEDSGASSQDGDSSGFSLVGETDSDVDLLLDAVKDPLDRLYKLSTKIRNPSTRLPFTQDAQPTGLSSRLGPEPLAVANEPRLPSAPTELSITTATRLRVAQFAMRDDMSTVSISEYSSTTEFSHDAGTFPSPPTRKEGDKYFECPYCFTVCSTEILRRRAWKAHLVRDLRPYICTYPECRNPEQLYDTRQDWIQHENTCHRTVWRCPSHQDQSFRRLGAFLAHVDDGHVAGVGTAVPESLIRASECTSDDSDRPCPVCLFSTEKTADMSKHIALHLERIALFSIPRSVGEDDDEGGGLGSQSVNLPDDDSRDDLSNNHDFLDDDASDENFYDADRGQTPISWAADCGHTEVVSLLLDSGKVNPDSKDASGWTPLAWAASKGYDEAVRLLLARDDVDANSRSASGLTPLAWSVVNGYDKVVERLLKSGKVDVDYDGSKGSTLMQYAFKSGNTAVATLMEEFLEDRGIHV